MTWTFAFDANSEKAIIMPQTVPNSPSIGASVPMTESESILR